MPDTIEKLRPDRDLQCFFFQPSAIAALSSTSPTGFTLSGTWRQQFDWAVIEWNRDCVYEHPAFRPLPDGDLSGLVLTYEEVRTNCIPMDSDLFATVDWPSVRVWAETPPIVDGGPTVEEIFFVALHRNGEDHSEPIEGSYSAAYAEFTLSGSVSIGDIVGLGYITANYTYTMVSGSSLELAIDAIVGGINFGYYVGLKAERIGTTIRIYYTGDASIADSTTGANGNRFSMYSYSTGAAVWDSASQTFGNGTSPTKWKVTLDFSTLKGRRKDPATGDYRRDPDTLLYLDPEPIPTDKIRKIRWTYSADLQPAEFVRSQFEVVVSNWTVTGTNRSYSVAGPGSRRIEDTDSALTYPGTGWQVGRGNYSGGFIHFTQTPGDAVSLAYTASGSHTLYLGTRYTNAGALLHLQVDGTTLSDLNLKVTEEDVLIRWSLGTYAAGDHMLTVTHAGASLEDFYLDFIELAVPTTDLPTFPDIPVMTLATDWDTDHSLALAPERTAWFIDSLGFRGRQNHYVGALLFYELHNPANQFAVASLTFSGTPTPGDIITVYGPTTGGTLASRTLHEGDTPETIALSFANEFNRGYTGLWASSAGATVTIQSRKLGLASGLDTLTMAAPGMSYTSIVTAGVSGKWLTDLTATPRLNRAMRDWTRSFFSALQGYGMDAVAAFSTELKHGDDSIEAGIAQRGPAGDPILLPTPSLQTNFSTTSQEFWRQVHADCAAVMEDAGLQPYLQLGEVQWWYFNDDGTSPHPFTYSGMPYYDDYTTSLFQTTYGRPMHIFLDNTADPADYPDEASFLASLLGAFSDNIISYVRTTHPSARFEVLYPYDVNQTPFNKAINFPTSSWTPTSLDCLKTEGFGFTFTKRLDDSEQGIEMGVSLGFPATQRSHLVGLGDATASWLKEARIATGKGFESVVLFALDQFCLIGYPVPLPLSPRRAVRFRS